MADSSYYHGEYKKKVKLVGSYEDDIEDLETIRDNFSCKDISNKINNVNTEISELKTDMGNAIRYNPSFTSEKNSLEYEKERAATWDTKLSVAVSDVEDEIDRIESLKSDAEDDRDYYYKKYEEKKAEEEQAKKEAREEFGDAVLGFLGIK